MNAKLFSFTLVIACSIFTAGCTTMQTDAFTTGVNRFNAAVYDAAAEREYYKGNPDAAAQYRALSNFYNVLSQ